jgi:hypothetical protein
VYATLRKRGPHTPEEELLEEATVDSAHSK